MAPKGANVFQPPPSGGTSSPQRATRWQATKQEDDNSDRAKSGRDTSSTSGKGKNKKSSNNKEDTDDRKKVPEHDHTVWYGEPGHDSLGPGGLLYKHTSSGVVRSGMCNPPQNPQVAKMLLEQLNHWEVRPHPKITKRDETPKNSRPSITLQKPHGGYSGFATSESTAVHKAALLDQSGSHRTAPTNFEKTDAELSKASSTGKTSCVSSTSAAEYSGNYTGKMCGTCFHQLQTAGGMVAGAHSLSAPLLASSGSAISSRLPSPVPMRGSRVSSAASQYRSTVRGTAPKPRKSSGKDAWEQFEYELKQAGKTKKPPLETGPEGEVKWKQFKLRHQSQELGYQIEQADVVELCHNAIYHNSFTRRSMHGSASSGFQSTAPSAAGHIRQVRDIRSHLDHTHDCLDPYIDTISRKTVTDELERNLLKYPPKLLPPPPEEAPSAEKYLELADLALKSGPYRLQAMAQQANISVLSGMKPLDRMESPSPEQRVEADDPLFGSPNTSPRSTHSGKPLPVPHWGRSGSAPLLKM